MAGVMSDSDEYAAMEHKRICNSFWLQDIFWGKKLKYHIGREKSDCMHQLQWDGDKKKGGGREKARMCM